MAKTGRLTFEKRQREIKKKEKRQEKLERRNVRNEARKNGEPIPGSEPYVPYLPPTAGSPEDAGSEDSTESRD